MPKRTAQKWKGPLTAVVVVALAAVVLLPSAPVFQEEPGRDSGVFLYAARQMLNGQTLYVDLWDHKGPIQFLFNVLGLLLPLPSWWGVWFVRVTLLSISLWLSIKILRRFFGSWAAWASTLSWLSFFAVFVGSGNFTEEYALGFSFVAVWLFTRVLSGSSSPWIFCLIGSTAGIVFLLRQNLLGTIAVVAIVSFFAVGDLSLIERLRRRVFPFLGGMVIVPGFILLWLISRGAIRSWWECTWVYNQVYVAGSSLPENLLHTIEIISGNPALFLLCFLLLLGETVAFPVVLQAESPMQRLLALGFFAWPVEFLASSLSGRGYDHYFIAWLVPGSILLAGLMGLLLKEFERVSRSGFTRAIGLLPLLISIVWFCGAIWINSFQPPLLGKWRLEAKRYLLKETGESDQVLIWGAESGLLVATGRTSPGPYFYSYPLLTTGYEPHRHLEKFLEGLRRRPPKLILDTSATNLMVPQITEAYSGPRPVSETTKEKYSARGLEPLMEFFLKNYREVALIGSRTQPWVVMEHVESGNPEH